MNWPSQVALAICLAVALIILPGGASAHAQPRDDEPVNSRPVPEDTAQQDPEAAEDEASFWDNNLVLPVVFFTPETRVGGGVSGVSTFSAFGNEPDDRASNVVVAAIYTMKSQMIFVVRPVLWMSADQHALEADIFFQIFPVRYYGIGNDTRESDEELFTLRSTNVGIKYLTRVHSRFYAGIASHLRSGTTLELEPEGLLATRRPPGTGPDTISGLGPSISWDSRDDVLWPSRGAYQQVTVTFYQSIFGSDHSTTKILIDQRAYLTTVADHVFAIQGRVEFNQGDVPFYALALTGGSELHRGYPEGRYRDKQLYAIQLEYRVPIWWRLGAVAFTSVAQVTDHMKKLRFERFRPAGGLGLRLRVTDPEKLNVRLDLAIGSQFALYINAKEAF